MQAVAATTFRRLALASPSSAAAPLRKRLLATAAASHADLSSSSTPAAQKVAPVNLANVEAMWGKLSEGEQAAVYEQLEAVQSKDWKELTLDEKKAAYFVAFGPHGSRAPISKPGDNMKIWASVGALVAAAGLLAVGVRQYASGPAPTMTKEWQEASNQRALEMKLDPISGISSEGYKGTGFVQSK